MFNFDINDLDTVRFSAGLRDPYGNLGITPVQWIGVMFPYIFGIAGIILIINIVASGIKMMMSQGDPNALKAAQARLTTSLIGIIILAVSFWTVRLVGQFLGIPIFDIFNQ